MRARDPIILAAVVACLLALPLIGDRWSIQLATEMLILGLFAISFNLLLGYGGLVSFGHAAFFAIGGYACVILMTTLKWPLAAAFPAAMGLAAVAALVIGTFCVRLTEIYFAMLTLAFAQFVWAIAFKWNVVTGGDNGFLGIALPDWARETTPFYYFTIAVVAALSAVLWLIVRSAFGAILVATRENPMRAGFVGIPVTRVQLVAFVISGCFSGAAGALYAMFKQSMFPDTAWWTRSADVLIMTILGGIYSFLGPFLGAGVLVLLNRMTAQYTVYWPTMLGLILLLFLFFFPSGLIGLIDKDARHAPADGPLAILRRLRRGPQRQP